MSSAKYFVWGGRWRELDAGSGRVAGWRRPRFVFVRRGRLALARRGALLRALRALAAGEPSAAALGPRLSHQSESVKRSPPRLQLQYRRVDVSTQCARDASTQAEPERERWATGTVSASTEHLTSSRAAKHKARETRRPGEHESKEEEGVSARPWRVVSRASGARAGAVPPVTLTRAPSPRPASRSSSASRGVCKELVVSAADVAALRGFVASARPQALGRFDADDAYKRTLFYAINPLVCLRRCAALDRALSERSAAAAPHFLARLGLTRAPRRARSASAEPARHGHDLQQIHVAKTFSTDTDKSSKMNISRAKRRARVSSSSTDTNKENIRSSRRRRPAPRTSASAPLLRNKKQTLHSSVVISSTTSDSGDEFQDKQPHRYESSTKKHTRRSDRRRSTSEPSSSDRLPLRSAGVLSKSTKTNEINTKHNVNSKPFGLRNRVGGPKASSTKDNQSISSMSPKRLLRSPRVVAGESPGAQDKAGGTKETVPLALSTRHTEAAQSKLSRGSASSTHTISKKVCSTRLKEYSNLEDHAIVAWVSVGGRARRVNGNALWRELQEQYQRITGNRRSWHSLRNRYLRYILPALGALALPPHHAQRLRAAAATGEIKRRNKPAPPRRNSIFAHTPTRSAAGRLRTRTHSDHDHDIQDSDNDKSTEERPVERPVERPAERPEKRSVERLVKRIVERSTKRLAERAGERPTQRPEKRPAERAEKRPAERAEERPSKRPSRPETRAPPSAGTTRRRNSKGRFLTVTSAAPRRHSSSPAAGRVPRRSELDRLRDTTGPDRRASAHAGTSRRSAVSPRRVEQELLSDGSSPERSVRTGPSRRSGVKPDRTAPRRSEVDLLTDSTTSDYKPSVRAGPSRRSGVKPGRAAPRRSEVDLLTDSTTSDYKASVRAGPVRARTRKLFNPKAVL